MFGLGFSEILVIAAIALVFIGPERLPEAMRFAGKMYGQLRRASDELRRAFVDEADRSDAEARLQELQERRKKAAEARKKALEAVGGSVDQEQVIARPTPPAPSIAAVAAPVAPAAPPVAPVAPPAVDPVVTDETEPEWDA